MDRLYSLYHLVITTVEDYKAIAWSDVVTTIEDMNETIAGFAQKCKGLPKALKKWEAYDELVKTIEIVSPGCRGLHRKSAHHVKHAFASM